MPKKVMNIFTVTGAVPLPGGPGQITVRGVQHAWWWSWEEGGGCSAKARMRVEKSDVGSVHTGFKT